MKQNIQMPNPREQQILDGLTIRLIRRDEHGCDEQLIDKQHCLKSAQLVGEQLRYVVEYDGEWLALLNWNAGSGRMAALHHRLPPVDRYLTKKSSVYCKQTTGFS
ncbi:hypothetical protein [Pontiella sulfatireligans]|nr:hypothetical protein [Pontiella sulfatireligans]